MNASKSCCSPTPTKQESAVSYFLPRYEVVQSEDQTEIRVELPGIKKDDLNISSENRELTIEATADSGLPETWKALHRETTDRAYRLRLRLGDQLNDSAISADLNDGILNLVIPRAEEAKPRSIKVK